MAKRRFNFLDKLLLPVALFLITGLVLSAVAGYTDPRKHIIIAFLGLAYPYLLLSNLLFLACWILRKKWLMSLLTIAAIAVGYKALKATWAFNGDEGNQLKDAKAIRMMTYNVHSFKLYGENNTPSIKEKMLQVVKDQNPDIICFQEFYTRYKGAFDTVDSLKALLNTKYYYFVPTSKNNYEASGLAIFSKYPIKNTGKITFDSSVNGNMSIYADLEIQDKLLRIYNVHLQSISCEIQDYDYLDKVKEMNTELQPPKRILKMLRGAFLKRSGQVDIMKKEMATCTSPFLIAGDFNDTPASYAVTQITKGLNNAFIEKGSGWGKTYNGKFPNFQIDYISTSKNIEILNYHITKAQLSDHFPVRSDIRFKF